MCRKRSHDRNEPVVALMFEQSVWFKNEKAVKTVFSSHQCNLTVLGAGLPYLKSCGGQRDSTSQVSVP
jgi:hypothetical protein